MAKGDNDYFRIPSTFNLIWVPIGMILLTLAYKNPALLPIEWMGPIGTVTTYMIEEQPKLLAIAFYGGWGLHLVEAIIAYFSASSKDMSDEVVRMWTAQTFVYGYFSLGYLLAYDPSKKSKLK